MNDLGSEDPRSREFRGLRSASSGASSIQHGVLIPRKLTSCYAAIAMGQEILLALLRGLPQPGEFRLLANPVE